MVKDKVATVGAVETRSMTKKEGEREDNYWRVPTSIFEGEDVSDKVMMQDEGVDRYSVAG